MTRPILLFIFFTMLLPSCKEDGTLKIFNGRNKAFEPVSKESLIQDRASWQKPEAVIQQMGDINDKVIADIGTGTGYFTYRFAIKGAEVIAVDIDQDMLDLISIFQSNLPDDIAKNIKTHLAQPDDAMLGKNSVDFVFISNTITYIGDKEAYLKNIKPALKENGKLVIIDFKKSVEEAFIPPVNERLDLESLVTIIQHAGYHITMKNTDLLEYQYMIIAE